MKSDFFQHLTYSNGYSGPLTDDHISMLMKICVVTFANKYTKILLEKKNIGSFMIVISGKVLIKTGKRTVKVLKKGDYFGGQVKWNIIIDTDRNKSEIHSRSNRR